MITLCIRYTFNPDHLADFRAYVDAEQPVIERSGGKIVGYFLPTDFAGPTNEATGLIDLPSLAAYEAYREVLANDPDHKKNVARLAASRAEVAMNRSIIQRV
jgi:NIPSNAP protein